MITFGPSGNCNLFYELGYKHSIQAPKWLHSLGITAYEYAFNRGVTISDDTAIQIGQEFKKYNIRISAHAPYYINFASTDESLVEKSYKYVIDSLKKLKLLGGNHLVVHTASCGKMDRETAVNLAKQRLMILKDKLISEGLADMYVCLETMGKMAQIGTYDEIVDYCTLFDHYIPTLDFGHINALTQGTLVTYDDYAKIIDYCISKLGYDRVKDIHIHFSKIEYGDKGEIRHLTFEDNKYGPDFAPLAQVLKDRALEPMIICESRGTQTMDAVSMKKMYEKLK